MFNKKKTEEEEVREEQIRWERRKKELVENFIRGAYYAVNESNTLEVEDLDFYHDLGWEFICTDSEYGSYIFKKIKEELK